MIYIQTVNGLTQVSPSLTKEKIIAALGYTPVDNATFYEDESGALLIADEKGYVIARIDENGLTTTQLSAGAIALNGEDLATKLQELADKVPEIDLSGYALKNEIPSLEGYAKTSDIPSVPDVTPYDTHVADEAIHVTEDQKTAWTNKSDFSGAYKDLSGAPNIVNDNQDEVVICDSAGNVILRATAEGLNVAAVYVNGEHINNITWKFEINNVEYEVTPTIQRWSDWVAANSNIGFTAGTSGPVVYGGLSSQYIIDVDAADFIIPGYKYTYNED